MTKALSLAGKNTMHDIVAIDQPQTEGTLTNPQLPLSFDVT